MLVRRHERNKAANPFPAKAGKSLPLRHYAPASEASKRNGALRSSASESWQSEVGLVYEGILFATYANLAKPGLIIVSRRSS